MTLKPSANKTRASSPRHNFVPVDESERLRVMDQVRTARAERPQMLERMKLRQKKGWAAAREVSKVLKRDFGVQRTVLFGSLLNYEDMDERSDIDLAVWGLAHNKETKAWSVASQILSAYNFSSIDLVPVEKAYPHIQKAIETEGVEL